IARCSMGSNECHDIHVDPSMPAWPAVSPDGSHVAFVTQFGTPRLRVILATGGPASDLGPAIPACGPVWSSANDVWSFQVTGNGRAWVEMDARTGEKTGKVLPLAAADQSTPDWPACSRETEQRGSPLFSSVRVEAREFSELRRFDK